MEDLKNLNFELGFNNFDPNEIQTEETINAVFVVDVSPSISNYEDELNQGFNSFIEEMQKSHVSDRLLVSTVEFCERVDVKTGFQPVSSVPTSDFRGTGNATALYDAVKIGLENAINYRKTLEDSGVICKTLLFVLTDGWDNHSKSGSAKEVKDLISDFLKNEKNVFTFESILFGIGKPNQMAYEQAQKDMGIKHLATIDIGTTPEQTAKGIRKMINFISSSISASSTGKSVPAVNF